MNARLAAQLTIVGLGLGTAGFELDTDGSTFVTGVANLEDGQDNIPCGPTISAKPSQCP